MSDKKADHDTHHLLDLRRPPDNLVALREELIKHEDICQFAQQGKTFEECLGLIALKLDIALDGEYDVSDLCGMLTTALRCRSSGYSDAIRTLPGMVGVELVETADGVILQESGAAIKLPPGAVVTDKPIEEFTPVETLQDPLAESEECICNQEVEHHPSPTEDTEPTENEGSRKSGLLH